MNNWIEFHWYFVEANRLANLRSYRGVGRSTDDVRRRRSMNSTIELSPEQAQITAEHFDFSRPRKPTSLLILPTQSEVISTIHRSKFI